jgi:phage baseplate assembly protein W
MSTSSKFKFKSSGLKKGRKETKREVAKRTDVGVVTPLSNRSGKGMFDMHTDAGSQLKDNMKNLIMTNHGERLGLAEYGANLYPVLFDLTATENLKQEVSKRILLAVERWMPAIAVDDIQVLEMDRTEKTLINKKSMTKIKLRVIFSLPAMGLSRLAVDIALVPGG